jgi:hypothetical protein
MDMKKRLNESKTGMNPMDALSKMIEQNRPQPPEPPPIPETRYPNTPPPPPEPMYSAGIDPRETQRPDIYPQTQPEIYPQDYSSPLDTVSQVLQPRRSYTQDASGNEVEIGYDGTPLSNYTPDQMAIHNAIMGITPSQSKYVFNGQGYDLVPNTPQATGVNMDTGGVRLSNGQFIGGYQNPNGGMEIGTPSFFQQYAGNPELMRALSDAYGYDVSNPDAIAKAQGQPQIGYNPMPNPEIGYNPDPNPMDGSKNSTNDFQKMMEDMRMQERMQDPRPRPDINPEPPRQDPRINPEPPRPFDMFDDNIGRRLG